MVSEEPPRADRGARTIRFVFTDITSQEIRGLVTIFTTEKGWGTRIYLSIEGTGLRPQGRYTVEVTGEGLFLSASFTADEDGEGASAKATEARVPPNFRPRFAVVGPGF